MAKNIVFLGLPTVGKSKIGQALARKFGLGFLDTDTWIEQKKGKKVSEIFDQDGEDVFRSCEQECLASLGNILNHVISPGSGIVDSEERFQEIKKVGLTVWIKQDPKYLASSVLMQPDTLKARPKLRPAVQIEDKEERKKWLEKTFQDLLLTRQPYFEKADFIYSHQFATVDQVVLALSHWVKSLPTDKFKI